jgi:hypothetical protein
VIEEIGREKEVVGDEKSGAEKYRIGKIKING